VALERPATPAAGEDWLIFQFHNLLPFLNATDNVAIVLQLAGQEPTEAQRRASDLLDYLEVGRRKHAFPAKLSGGEAQRVAIARALANHPRIILADEPTAALDSRRARIVVDLLSKLARDQNAAVIAVTHDEKIFDRFDRMFMLRDGPAGGHCTHAGRCMTRSLTARRRAWAA
jgi:putative ABC transport system ATP-binding protein